MSGSRKAAFTLIDGQIIQRFARVMQWHAIVTSGAYRQRGRGPSDEERLADAVGTLRRHCELLDELVDLLPVAEEEDPTP